MAKDLICVSLHFTNEEAGRLEEAWRQDLSIKNRAEYIKTAINKHAQKNICSPRLRGTADKLVE